MLIQLSKKERARYAERKDLNKELKRILDEWNNSKLTPLKHRIENHHYTTKAVDDTLTDNTLNRRGSTPSFETLSLSQAEIECSHPKWPDLYDDYLEIVVQFGYIIFLSALFPMAAFFSLLNNLLEIRTDAFKLCMIYQRPFSQRVKDIGHWQVSETECRASATSCSLENHGVHDHGSRADQLCVLLHSRRVSTTRSRSSVCCRDLRLGVHRGEIIACADAVD